MRRRVKANSAPDDVPLKVHRFRLEEWAGEDDWQRYVAWSRARRAFEATHGELGSSGTYPDHSDADEVPDEPFDPTAI